jgi:hypothetical protein
MPSVADYIVYRDDEFSLNPGEARAFSEHLQNNLTVGQNRINPILAFKAKSTPTGLGAFQVEVNTKLIYSPAEVLPGDLGGLWEVFPGSILNPGINNTVQFRAIKKKWWFSDVVLWIQVQI